MTSFPLPLGATGPAQAEPRSLAAIGLMRTDLGRTYSGLMGNCNAAAVFPLCPLSRTRCPYFILQNRQKEGRTPHV